MIYTVGKGSPTRYHIQGAESDSEEDDYEAMQAIRTPALAKDVFDNPSSYTFEMEVKFVNVFKKIERKNEVRRQTVKACQVEVDATMQKITCLFTADDDNPIFFSYNHEARYSKVTLFVTGTERPKEPIQVFRSYIPSKEYTITSLDTHLGLNLKVPLDETLKKIKPEARRKLFAEADEPTTVTVHSINDQLKVGAILQVEKVSVTLATES